MPHLCCQGSCVVIDWDVLFIGNTVPDDHTKVSRNMRFNTRKNEWMLVGGQRHTYYDSAGVFELWGSVFTINREFFIERYDPVKNTWNWVKELPLGYPESIDSYNECQRICAVFKMC
jgi:hypothetical protein